MYLYVPRDSKKPYWSQVKPDDHERWAMLVGILDVFTTMHGSFLVCKAKAGVDHVKFEELRQQRKA